MSLVDRELLGHAEGLPGWEDGDLRHRIRMLRVHGNQGVASLMDGNRSLLVRQERVGRLSPSEEEAVPGIGEIPGRV